MPEPLKYAPYEHLFQHIKQSDVRLYESLKKISRIQEDTINTINAATGITRVYARLTFGIVETFGVADDLTLHGEVSEDCDLEDVIFNVKNPGDASMIFDLKYRPVGETDWVTILKDPFLVIPANDDSWQVYKQFSKPSLKAPGMMRIDCLACGSVTKGDGLECVLRARIATLK